MNESLTFEQAQAQLEQSVKKLESGMLTLDERIKEYAHACELIAYCQEKLNTMRGKVEEIKNNGGVL